MDLGLKARPCSSPAAARASAWPARAPFSPRVRRWRSCRAARPTSRSRAAQAARRRRCLPAIVSRPGARGGGSTGMADVERRIGPIDVLVNSAGAARRYPPEDLNAAAWHAAMDAKYFTYMHAMDAVLPWMAQRGNGAVVNIIGMGGKVATPIHLPGGAANSALMLATVGLASVYGPKGVRINAINPGATMTDRVRGAALEASAPWRQRRRGAGAGQAKVPLGRYAAPGRRRERRAVSGLRAGELPHRRDRADGRRQSIPVSERRHALPRPARFHRPARAAGRAQAHRASRSRRSSR